MFVQQQRRRRLHEQLYPNHQHKQQQQYKRKLNNRMIPMFNSTFFVLILLVIMLQLFDTSIPSDMDGIFHSTPSYYVIAFWIVPGYRPTTVVSMKNVMIQEQQQQQYYFPSHQRLLLLLPLSATTSTTTNTNTNESETSNSTDTTKSSTTTTLTTTEAAIKEEPAFFMATTTTTTTTTTSSTDDQGNKNKETSTEDVVIKNNTPPITSSASTSPPIVLENLGKAAVQMGSDFFTALRWGAANAITSSLPNNQRQILLNRIIAVQQQDTDLNDIDDDDDKGATTGVIDESDEDGYPTTITNSVNEAIVASIVTTTQKNENKWNKTKDILYEQAEIAVQKRIQSEFVIQQERYQNEIQRIQALSSLTDDDDEDDDDDDDNDDGKIGDISKAINSAFNVLQQEQQYHPILGPVIYDFGYKRIHLISAELLATIPIWKKQRIYRQERVKSMTNDKLKTLHLGFPGIICIHEERNTGKLSIIDGQHRVGMMILLQEKQQQQLSMSNDGSNSNSGLSLIDLDHILVEVYTESEPYTNDDITSSSTTSSSFDHAQDLFTEINKAEPVKLVDMPGVATAKERKMISAACNRLQDQYSTMFSASQKCRPPNVNIDNLRDSIYASNVLKRHKTIQSTKLLYNWLVEQNNEMGYKYNNSTELVSSMNEKVWNKAQSTEFYLGLDSSWLYN